jgi:hypothetical protein
MPGIAKFEQYLTNLPSPKDFSGSRLLEIMATFQQPFEDHMRAEITTIANLSQHPRTPREGSQKEKSENAAIEAREGKNLVFAGVIDVLPFFLFNFDREYEDGLWRDWPIPAPVRWTFISVARVLHPGWWKFASCDAAGQTRELYAVPESKS